MKVKLFVKTMEPSHGSGAAVASRRRGACPPPPQSSWTAPFTPLHPPLLPQQVHVLWLIWMGMSEATSNTCSRAVPLKRCRRHHIPPPALLPRYQPVFLCPARIAGRLCDLLKPGRHVIALLDTKNSRQPVFFGGGGGGREGRRKTI